jgi:hypothetical protein
MEILGTNRGPALRCDLEHSMHPASFSRDLDARFQSPGALNAGGRADFHHQSGEGEALYLDDASSAESFRSRNPCSPVRFR